MERQDQQNPTSSSNTPLRPYNSLPDRPVLANGDTSGTSMALRPKPLARRYQTEATISGGMAPFAGRLGGNQSFVLDRSDPANAALLKKVPDAAANLRLNEMFDLNGFREVDLYKAALCECFGEPLSKPTSPRRLCPARPKSD